MFANAVGVAAFLVISADDMLKAVVDPLHPEWSRMDRAWMGYSVFAVSIVAVILIALFASAGYILRRARPATSRAQLWRRAAPVVLSVALTALVVPVFIEVLIFRDYGVHFYEFDVVHILANAALRRDLGIQPAEVARVFGAGLVLLGAEVVLCFGALRISRWRQGALSRACVVVLLVAAPLGLLLFRTGEQGMGPVRAEFVGALPLGHLLLMRPVTRPFIAVAPRLGAAGYPVLGDADRAPAITDKKNIVFIVPDGLRGDMVRPDLTPNLLAFAARQDVIHSQRHYSTGHVSESGIFGLLYGIDGQAFHSFVDARVRPYPVDVLKRNGYRTLLVASSRLNPYPSDQLIRSFDEVVYPANDDDAIAQLSRYVAARRADHTPYFVLAFLYTPHYPFTTAKPAFRKFPLVGPSARTNYMNDVLQADDYFRQTFEIFRASYDSGRTIVVATSDHGEEIRDHGVFGHAAATFWNEKLVVPLMLGLPGRAMSAELRAPKLTSHADLWPTIFDYLQLQVPPFGRDDIHPVIPRSEATRNPQVPGFSKGYSLLGAIPKDRTVYVSGRFFPYADRPSVLIDSAAKYWFHVRGVDGSDRLCIQLTRITDLDDRPLSVDMATVRPDGIGAFLRLQHDFWRFIRPDSAAIRRLPSC